MFGKIEFDRKHSNKKNLESNFQRSISSPEYQKFCTEKNLQPKILELLKIKSEPNIADKIKIVNMYEWESNADTVICRQKETSPPEGSGGAADCGGAEGDGRSLDSSISDRWMSIVGRVNDEPLLEDEAVPVIEFCESSPETQHFKSFDNTLLEPEPKWRLVTDESFIKMEQMVMSPVKRSEVTPESKKLEFLNESNFIVFSPLKKIDDLLDISKNKDSDNTQSHSEDKYETCESYDSNAEQKLTADKTNICNNTLEEMDSYLADSEGNSNDNANSLAADDSLCPSQNSAADESLKFNDTLEEMEHLIKFGMNYIVSKPEEQKLEMKENIHETNESPVSTFWSRSPAAAAAKPESSMPAARKYTPLPRSSKENIFKLRSPRFIPPSNLSSNLSPFKLPKKTPSSGKKFFYKSPPSVSSPKAPPKFENILSPIQYYINNSPVVPKIKNISPGHNLWEKHAQRAASSGEAVKSFQDREQVPLQKKAYKSSVTTKLLETPPKQRLPRNFKVELMAENLPKPTVIKHERREKFSGPLREHTSGARCTSRGPVHSNEESFANMALTSGDVSLCIKKPAVRSHTLK